MSYDSYKNNSRQSRFTRSYGFQGRAENTDEAELGGRRNSHNERFGTSFNVAEVRSAFIRKVYAIVGIEMFIISVITAIFLFSPLRDIVYGNSSWRIIYLVLTFAFLILVMVLVCCPADKVIRNWPVNICLLTVIVIVMGFILGIISAYYTVESIMIAAGLTTGTVLLVSLFAFFTRIDFTRCIGFLFILTIFLSLFGLAFMLVVWLADDYTIYVMKMIYGGLGALVILFSLVVDTQMMMIGKHKYTYSPENYVFAALSLILDIFNLFLYILLIVGNER